LQLHLSFGVLPAPEGAVSDSPPVLDTGSVVDVSAGVIEDAAVQQIEDVNSQIESFTFVEPDLLDK
jgi:hypothetical protein